MKNLKPLPHSRAKTAWGLLQAVKRAILAEPKRIYMSSWQDDVSPAEGGPSCGTVACLAGWVTILGHGKLRPTQYGEQEQIARNLLGNNLNYFTEKPVLDNSAGYVFSPFGDDLRGELGTKAYAKSVVERIDRFILANEKALKAKRLAR